MTIARVTHAPSGDAIRKSSEAAARDNIMLLYSDDETAGNQANLVQKELVSAIEKGTIQFAVGQQPCLQDYLAIEALWLYKTNGNFSGGGEQPSPTGPAFAGKTDVEAVASFASKGTDRATARRCQARGRCHPGMARGMAPTTGWTCRGDRPAPRGVPSTPRPRTAGRGGLIQRSTVSY